MGQAATLTKSRLKSLVGCTVYFGRCAWAALTTLSIFLDLVELFIGDRDEAVLCCSAGKQPNLEGSQAEDDSRAGDPQGEGSSGPRLHDSATSHLSGAVLVRCPPLLCM